MQQASVSWGGGGGGRGVELLTAGGGKSKLKYRLYLLYTIIAINSCIRQPLQCFKKCL